MITIAIAEKAEEENLAVAAGDLEDIQDQGNGKTMNWRLHSFPLQI
ncbi:MAG: IS605 OrfB-like transposable element containing RNAse H-like and Zn finger domain [Candidatus Methanohalarchaeum thermophilum]|uniref:IS605 OrfB-like transposable element containing RNAse H-like and Zn finger domain n=1 Tax=Methanohalarchaeum thermophilum TaxID=1903181 RepID=A0A1Q6DWV2_METT1|nr:MAG: IS605 OrfB-like transposable element containing RNAse H-like and Zn finger domain [Candidatus Methanohalarchaeum thermophilum]